MRLQIIPFQHSPTDGLASGYQRTYLTSFGTTIVQETGGLPGLVRLIPLPQWPFVEPALDVGQTDERTDGDAVSLLDALAAEADYAAEGRQAFMTYREYRARRLG